LNTNIKREISRNIPRDMTIQFSNNTVPLFTAYGCVLLERDTGKSYIYTAVNLKNRKREVISRRSTPLTTNGVSAIAEKIRMSNVAGAGKMEADRVFGDKMAQENCKDILSSLFCEILPQCGFNIRDAQISLADEILDAISRRSIFLAEAEVGTGKTLAYLAPAIIAKRGRLNCYWNMSFYTGSPYVEMAHMPIVVATSSIALQKAIITDYIPQLSQILMDYGVIKTPLTAVLRKGREHYICERKLRAHILFERNAATKETLEELLSPRASIDLAEADGLTPYVKRKICVPDRCDKHCPHRAECQYLRFREQSESPNIDIQVCNHNYLLADAMRRSSDQRPIIPNYQMIIIDEAHKFLQAARSMYGVEMSVSSLLEIKEMAYALKFRNGAAQDEIRTVADKLAGQACRLFRRLEEQTQSDDTDSEAERFSAAIDTSASRNLRNIRDMSDSLIEMLQHEALAGSGLGRKSQLLWELEQIRNQATILAHHDDLICWVEIDSDCRLCGIPKDLSRRLYDDLWSKGVPTILTSGTLSAAGDFSYVKKSLGINYASRYRVLETSKSSPFNYAENALIYISADMPFPNQSDRDYIFAVANEIEQLLYASHGHAAVLFTSYKAMDMVLEHLEDRGIPFPMFRLGKGNIKEIEHFKQSGNGVLFAAGSLWEGIDIPGDTLSNVIIVKLPFAVPDPIGEYEQTLYDSMDEYKDCVIKPNMQVRLKQGAGRGIRTEYDTAIISIIDIRANKTYKGITLDALPNCPVTNKIEDVERFTRVKKSAEYFA